MNERNGDVACTAPAARMASGETPTSPLRGLQIRSPATTALEVVPQRCAYGSVRRWIFLSILFFVVTSNYFDYYILSVLLEPIKREFRVSDTSLGALSGFSFAIFYALSALPIAHWADYGNRRTVITLTLAGWSITSMACGLARSFWQLVVARFGVGLMEPGALPPAQSLVMDYFPPQQRGTAMALLTMGASAVGWLLGVGVGGYFTAAHGWRSAFLMAGGPGLVLALVVHFVLAEPRERLDNSAARVRAEGLLEALSHLRRKRSFVLALAGSSAYLIFGYGIAVFLPSFMIRTFHATVTQVSGTWGCTIAAADAIGGLIGGWMADRLGTRDVRWYMWLPAVTCALGVPLYVLALTAHTAQSFIVLDFVAECTLSIGYPVFFVAVQAICGGRRRTMASATAQFAGILVGSGLGPLMAGALSDAFDSQYSSESLRHSLMVMTVFLIPAAIAFYWASRTLPLELEE